MARMPIAEVRDAYAARAAEYTDLFGRIEAAAEQDRAAVLAWARSLTGRILDVGCGPGQWTNHLVEHGCDVEGIDPVPEFIDEARRRHPGVAYRVGQADELADADTGLGGILAWYSLIHTEPDRLGGILAEFARRIRPGGGLAIGFFEGPRLEAFDHAVITAYCWPIDLLAQRVERAGFVVTELHARGDPGVRRHGMILARR